MNLLAYLLWDPPREMFPFDIPLLGRPILWYGFFFALGFLGGYLLFLSLLKEKSLSPKQAKLVAEKTIFYILVGTIVGARLGDILFYQGWQSIAYDPLIIFKVWQGGLASHGGALGVLIAVFFLTLKLKRSFPQLTFLSLLDLIVIPTGFVAAMIRIGNFFNQEILGKPTRLPWAIIFGHPADGSVPVPRHPVQLYEALFYLLVSGLTYLLWKKVAQMRKKGKMVGLFLSTVFIFRFFIEFIKEEQSALIQGTHTLTMGQFLSVPFIFLGLFLLCHRAGRHERH